MGLPGGPVEEETPSLEQILRHAGLARRRGQGHGSCTLHAAIASPRLRPHRETTGYTNVGTSGVIRLPPSVIQLHAEQIQVVLQSEQSKSPEHAVAHQHEVASAAQHAKAAQKGEPVEQADWLGTPAHLRALAVAISNCRDDGLAPTRVFVVEVAARHSKSPVLTARACRGAQFETALGGGALRVVDHEVQGRSSKRMAPAI